MSMFIHNYVCFGGFKELLEEGRSMPMPSERVLMLIAGIFHGKLVQDVFITPLLPTILSRNMGHSHKNLDMFPGSTIKYLTVIKVHFKMLKLYSDCLEVETQTV